MTHDNIRPDLDEFLKLTHEFDAKTLEELISKTKDENKDIRFIAAMRLRNLEDTRSIPTLIGLLKDSYWRVRCTAVFALGHYKSVDSKELLIDLLHNDESTDVRAICAIALADIGDADDEIITALSDTHSRVKTSAATVLGRNKVVSAIKPLSALLDDTNWRVRYSASVALMDIDAVNPQVINALESLREIPDAIILLQSLAESDILMNIDEKYEYDIDESMEEEYPNVLDSLRNKYGEDAIPFPPSDPLGDLIADAKKMLGSDD